MSIATTVSALQTKHAAISGVRTAPTAMPSNLSTAVLPIALVWPSAATWSLQAMGLKRQEREYEVRVYVQPVAEGVAGPDAGYQACLTLLELFGQAYQGDPDLSASVDHLLSCRDEGVTAGLTWGQITYWGFVYHLTVVEKSS